MAIPADPASPAASDSPLRQIGSRVEPFLDHWLIDRLRGAELRLHPPQRREIVLEMNGPAECSTSYYYNLFQDDGLIRLYYRGWYPPGENSDASNLQTANYAHSRDGVRFERPRLGLVEHDGSTANHVVWRGIEAHNFCAFRDDNPACPPDQRYKAVGGEWMKLRGLVSPDGLRWRRLRDEPLQLQGAFDSLNVPFWDPLRGCYRMFLRNFTPEGVRIILSARSDDFIHWSDPVPHQYEDGGEPEQYYTNGTVPCPGAEHILLSFPKRFLPQRTRDTAGMVYPGEGVSDTLFMSSRDGVRWRRSREAWLRPGPDPRNWTHRCNLVAAGIAVTSPQEWSLYAGEHYGWDSNRLRRLSVRPFGFVSLHADRDGGSCLTHPLRARGTLRLNYATSAAGSVQVEVQDPDGRALPGFRFRDMAPLFGDEMDAPLRWRDGKDTRALDGRPFRLKFRLVDADLFALRFDQTC